MGYLRLLAQMVTAILRITCRQFHSVALIKLFNRFGYKGGVLPDKCAAARARIVGR